MAIAVHDIPKRFATSVALEIALLILICAPDQDICAMAVNCISLLCEETVITQEINNPNIGQLSLLENIDVYMELSAPSAVVAGTNSVVFSAPFLIIFFAHSLTMTIVHLFLS